MVVTAVVEAAKNGQELVSCVKTSFSKSPKEATDKEMMKNCPLGSYYVVAICNVSDEEDDIKIIFISCKKYNAKRFYTSS